MMPIEEMRKKRFQFLHKLYEEAGGDELACFKMFKVGKELGFDGRLTQNIAQYLEAERLIKFIANQGLIGISHWGVREVEESLSNPDKPTKYFPPAVNIIYIGQMTDSQIQQASPEATQVVTISESNYEELKEIIKSLKEPIDQLNFQPQQKTDFESEIQTIEAQMSSSKPKSTIITECLGSIKQILKGATSSAIASLLLNKIITLLAKLGGG